MAFVPIYILILGFTIIIDYYAGLFIANAVGQKRQIWLTVSIIANIGVLAIFKYFNFFNATVTALLGKLGIVNHIPYLAILLPIGLSFHTFQAMSYTIEVYRGNQKPERHLGIYALYVMFYPQLVAGPIERPQNLLHQFYQKHQLNYTRVTNGLKLIAWGLFKKIVIADRLSILVDNVYDDPYHHHGLSFIIATVCFTFQIFCDFSGYSDMAIGVAKVMGFTLMKNFNTPYHSKSIKEFWGRWHISLSTWFKDYLYIPLGGNRVPLKKWCFNILLVFVVSGLWHGANYTYLIWGGLHGFYFIFAALTYTFRQRVCNAIGLGNHTIIGRALQILTTFTLVSFAWIFFRAKTVGIAFYIIKSMFTHTLPDFYNLLHHTATNLNLGLIGNQLVIAVLAVAFLEAVHITQRRYPIISTISKQPAYMRWAIYYTFMLMLILFGEAGSRQFIYFQF